MDTKERKVLFDMRGHSLSVNTTGIESASATIVGSGEHTLFGRYSVSAGVAGSRMNEPRVEIWWVHMYDMKLDVRFPRRAGEPTTYEAFRKNGGLERAFKCTKSLPVKDMVRWIQEIGKMHKEIGAEEALANVRKTLGLRES